jgi:hypothetical protein
VLAKEIKENSSERWPDDGRIEPKSNGSLQKTAKIETGNPRCPRSNGWLFGQQSLMVIQQNFFAAVVG